MPSDKGGPPNRFDRFADWVDQWTSKSHFFVFCAGMVVAWLGLYFLVRNVDTWQLIINSPTTVITFLLVSLAANTGRRMWAATQQKLNAMSVALAELLAQRDDQAARELRQAVGLEERESSD